MKDAPVVQNRYILLLDVVGVFLSYFVSLFLISGTANSVPLVYSMSIIVACTAVCFCLLFGMTGIYSTLWPLAGTRDYIKLIVLCITSAIVATTASLVIFLISPVHRNGTFVKVRLCLMTQIFFAFYAVTVRMCVRAFAKISAQPSSQHGFNSNPYTKNLLIVGAGSSAAIVIKDMMRNANLNRNFRIVGLVDDNPLKLNTIINGYHVLGNRNDIARICDENKIDQILLAIPSASVSDKKEIIEICSKVKAKLKIVPSVDQIITQTGSTLAVRNVQIEDLLERSPIVLNNREISGYIEGKTVMVTGGGGSIGSELCRQIMKYNPKNLVIVDIYENNAYDIQMELNSKYPDNKPTVLIASVRDKDRIDDIFKKYNPYIVFHAAAHKHVPLMEVSPCEAIKNNVFGTLNVAMCADKYNVKRFVMISTDKAVNPTNIMGATKRICEMIVQSMQKISSTEFVAVRFGNVLGSNGSVIPLFKRQIEDGGPVTVTHKDITRFFMTIPEAAQLVLQAAGYAGGGEIFVLDMGKPVKIYDLAKNLIRLSGYTPNVDIDIKVTGLRPGEKLYEELLMSEEGLKKTRHSKIFIGSPLDVSMEELKPNLDMLAKAAEHNNIEGIKDVIEKTVPTYIRHAETVNEHANQEQNSNYASQA